MFEITPKNNTLLTVLLFIVGIPLCNSQEIDCINNQWWSDVEHLQTMLFRHHSDSAIAYGDSILNILENEGILHCQDALAIQLEIGEAYEFKNTRHKAIEIYHEIIPIAYKQGYYEILAETYISLARSHEASGRSIDCKRYLDEAHEIIKEHNLERAEARLAYRTSSYYRQSDTRDTAVLLAKKAVELGKKHNRIRAIGDGYMLLGILEPDSKIRQQYFAEGRDINIIHKAYHSVLTLNMSVAREYVVQGNIDEAIKLTRKNFNYEKLLREELGYQGFYNYYGLNQAHRLLANAYKQHKDSVKYHREREKYYYSKFNNDTDVDKMSEIETKKSVEIEKLKQALLENDLKSSRQVIILISILGLLSTFFLFWLVKINRRFKKQNELISSQNTQLQALNNHKETLLSEVHHRVKNNLQNVISLLSLQELKMEDPMAKIQINDVANKIYSIALIHEQLYRDGDFEIVELHSYFTDLVNHYQSISADKSKQFHYNIDTNDIKLNIETVIPLGIICAEVINNTIKYGGNNQNISLAISTNTSDNSSYTFKYRDHGPGFPDSVINGKSSGMGIMLLKSMTRQLDGQLNIYNNEGAITELIFKQKEVSKI